MLFNFFNWKNRAVTYTFFTAFTKNENECSYALYCCGCISCSDVSNFLQSHGLQPVRFLCPWNSPGKNTGVGCHSLLQRIFPAQGLNLGLLHCSQTLYCLSYREDLYPILCFCNSMYHLIPCLSLPALSRLLFRDSSPLSSVWVTDIFYHSLDSK